jgi:predicted MarR family transcription regulator
MTSTTLTLKPQEACCSLVTTTTAATVTVTITATADLICTHYTSPQSVAHAVRTVARWAAAAQYKCCYCRNMSMLLL